MSVLFTIELRVACDTDNKYVLARRIVQQAARQAYANAMSLDCIWEVRVCSDDYEHGRRHIVLDECSGGDNLLIEQMSAALSEALDTRRPTRAANRACTKRTGNTIQPFEVSGSPSALSRVVAALSP
jgi:hypothetical protein